MCADDVLVEIIKTVFSHIILYSELATFCSQHNLRNTLLSSLHVRCMFVFLQDINSHPLIKVFVACKRVKRSVSLCCEFSYSLPINFAFLNSCITKKLKRKNHNSRPQNATKPCKLVSVFKTV